jgi:hypothetical protein
MKKLKNKIKFHLMRKAKSKKLREYFINKQASNIGVKKILKHIGKPVKINNDELSLKGYTNLGLFLSESEVNNLIKKTENFNCFDPFRKELGLFKFSEISSQVHVANYKRKDLSTLKEIMEIANNSDILEAVQDFLGATPTISNINMWWSLSGKEEAEQAQLFHRDVDDFKFCKLFVYLTDVEMENGPHVYVEGSSSSEKLRKIRRYKDSEIFDAFGEDKVKYFTAPKGSAFIVDTYGFHKGFLPKKGKRLLLQVQYSLNPIGIESYEPINIGSHNYDKYINRLILQ